MATDELDLNRHGIRLVGDGCRADWDRLTLEQREAVLETLTEVQRTGRREAELNFSYLNRHRAPERLANLSVRVFFYNQVPGNLGLYVVAAERKNDDPEATPELDVVGIAETNDVVSGPSMRQTRIKKRILKTPEVWGLPPETPPNQIKRKARESLFPYIAPYKKKRPAPRKPESEQQYEQRMAERLDAERQIIEDIRVINDLALELAPTLGPRETREIFSKIDSIFASFSQYFGYRETENSFLRLKGKLSDHKLAVSVLLAPLFGSKEQRRLYAKAKPLLEEPPRFAPYLYNVNLPWYREYFSSLAEKSPESRSTKTQEFAQRMGLFFPQSESLEVSGVDAASMESVFERRGKDRGAPFTPRLYRLAVLPALRESQQAAHSSKSAGTGWGDYVVDNRSLFFGSDGRRIRIPAGMVRITRFSENRFALLTVQTLDRAPGEASRAEKPRYRTIVLDILTRRSIERGALANPRRVLRRVEQALIEEARKQGVPPHEITNPETSPFLIHPYVDPVYGSVWPERWDHSSVELPRSAAVDSDVIDAYRSLQDANRVAITPDESPPPLISEAEHADALAKGRLSRVDPTEWKASEPIVLSPGAIELPPTSEGSATQKAVEPSVGPPSKPDHLRLDYPVTSDPPNQDKHVPGARKPRRPIRPDHRRGPRGGPRRTTR